MGYHNFQKKKKKYAESPVVTAVNYCSQRVPDYTLAFNFDNFSNDEVLYCKIKKPKLELGTNIFQQDSKYCASETLFNMSYEVENFFIESCNYCEYEIFFEMDFVSSSKFTENVDYCYRPL